MPQMLANFAMGLGNRLLAFSKRYVTSSLESLDIGDLSAGGHGYDVFSTWEARLLRYALYWAYYENSAYDQSVHTWAQKYKSEYALYRYTRGVYNPFNRLGEFWATRLMGGSLDLGAGDGKGVPSALPILTSNDALRKPIAHIWQDSNWQVNKEVFCRMGAVLGDVALKVDDDVDAGRVSLEIVNPGTLRWVDQDRRGNVRGYIIEEKRLDPDYDPRAPKADSPIDRACWYREEAFRDGEMVTYATFKNGEPYAWNGRAANWEVEYGFIPMVLVPHQKMSVSSHWGLSEFHAALPKAREVDDLGSHQHDQIRKAVWPKWLFTGIQNPSNTGRSTRFRGEDATSDSVEPGREEVGAIYGPSGATAYPLMYDLQLQFSSIEIQNQLENLERDYPEIQLDSTRVSGDASGKAQVEARRKTAAKVQSRRTAYDDAMVRALQMAIAIGGMRGYRDFEGFGLGSYADGKLDMKIGERPVFELDPADNIALETAFWAGAEIADRAGCPLQLYLERNNWTKEQVDRFRLLRAEQVAQAIEQTAAMTIAQAPPEPATVPAQANPQE